MTTSEDKQSLAIIRAILWGFAGFLYSAVFLGVWRYLELAGPQWWHLAAAAGVAGAFVAAFYSAKRAAIVGALAGTVSSQVMLVYLPPTAGVWPLVLATFLAGLGMGIAASFVYERRRGVLAVLIAGGVAGVILGLAIHLVSLLLPGTVPPMVMTFVLVPGTGMLFYVAALRAKGQGRPWIPHWLSVGLAASWLSVIVGGSMWMLALTLTYEVDSDMYLAAQAVFGQFPGALLGGVLGGATAGAALELLNVRWVSRF